MVTRARGREIDLAIAACALSWEARLRTVNAADFEDVPGPCPYANGLCAVSWSRQMTTPETMAAAIT
jgi:hypothetical protein